MPLLSPINQIAALQNGDLWNPITESQNQAQSIEDAMLSMPTYVVDANDRDARFGLSPLPGSSCFRADAGWCEMWFDAKTNGGGYNPGRPAGWYPVFGSMPALDFSSVAGTDTTVSANWTSKTGLFSSVTYAKGAWDRSAPTMVQVPFPGRYSVNAEVTIGGSTAQTGPGARIRVDNLVNIQQSVYRVSASTSSGWIIPVNTEVNIGSSFTFDFYSTVAGLGITITRAAVRYLGPL